MPNSFLYFSVKNIENLLMFARCGSFFILACFISLSSTKAHIDKSTIKLIGHTVKLIEGKYVF